MSTATPTPHVDIADPAACPPPPTLSRSERVRFLREARRDMVPALDALHAAHGPIARLPVPGSDIVFISRAEDAHRVFFLEQDRYPKGEEYDVPALGLRSGLVTSRGEEWKRDRAMLNPLFAKRHLEPLAVTMGDCTETLLRTWERLPDGAQVDVAHDMMRCTLDIAARTLFGSRLPDADVETFGAGIEEVLQDMLAVGNSPLTWGLSTLPGMSIKRATRAQPRRVRRIDRRLEQADAIVERIIAERRGDPDAPTDDFLALMLAARDDEHGTAMSHQKVLDQSATFLGAGHETTASALAWTWHLLAEHPAVRERMLAEIDAVLDGRPPTFADVDRLVWTKAVFAESLRVRPPVYLSMRRAQQDDVLGGYRVRANSVVILMTHLLHRDPDLWPDPIVLTPSASSPAPARAARVRRICRSAAADVSASVRSSPRSRRH